MKPFIEWGLFGSAVIAGWILGGYAPKGLVPATWRVPIATAMVAIGMALALIAIS